MDKKYTISCATKEDPKLRFGGYITDTELNDKEWMDLFCYGNIKVRVTDRATKKVVWEWEKK